MGKRKKKAHNRRYTPSSGAAKFNIDLTKLAAQMQANTGPQTEQGGGFTPGAPIQPSPGITLSGGPRQWVFPVGYNIASEPRSTEENSFETLRSLAMLCDAIQICEQVWFDYTAKLELEIKPKSDVLEAAGGDPSVFAEDIQRYKSFFAHPDPSNGLSLKAWMRKALRETLELDALPIYIRRNRIGEVCGLEIVDGSTIKPLITVYGSRPQPPYPAFQQFWMGAPMGWYTSDEMIYLKETERADSVYGFARVERILVRVNQLIRKQNKDMSLLTEGNAPLGTLEVPPVEGQEWTQESLIAFQQMWDAIYSGNDKMRSRIKLVPPGSKFTAIEDLQLTPEVDKFLMNITVAAFGLTMAELSFTEDVNKSSGDSQEAVTYRRAMRPLMNRFAELFTYIIEKYFGDSRFEVCWKGYEESEDLVAKSTALSNFVKVGILSASNAARQLGYPVDQEIPEYYASATGPIFFNQILDPQVLTAQKQAQLKGLELGSQGKQQGKPGQEEDENDDPPKPGDGEDEEDARMLTKELRKWREVALKDVRAGKPVRTFASNVIPAPIYRAISAELTTARTAEQVRTVFWAVRGGTSQE